MYWIVKRALICHAPSQTSGSTPFLSLSGVEPFHAGMLPDFIETIGLSQFLIKILTCYFPCFMVTRQCYGFSTPYLYPILFQREGTRSSMYDQKCRLARKLPLVLLVFSNMPDMSCYGPMSWHQLGVPIRPNQQSWMFFKSCFPSVNRQFGQLTSIGGDRPLTAKALATSVTDGKNHLRHRFAKTEIGKEGLYLIVFCPQKKCSPCSGLIQVRLDRPKRGFAFSIAQI